MTIIKVILDIITNNNIGIKNIKKKIGQMKIRANKL